MYIAIIYSWMALYLFIKLQICVAVLLSFIFIYSLLICMKHYVMLVNDLCIEVITKCSIMLLDCSS